MHKNDNGEPIDFVLTGSNHHMGIYDGQDGDRKQYTVSFWEAVERKRQGLPVVQSEFEGYQLSATLAINDLFVIGPDPAEVDFMDPKNKQLISKYLYRVQKTYGDGNKINVWFRHHLMTRNESNKEEEALSKSMKKLLIIQSLKSLQGTKVRVNKLGDIVEIGETILPIS